MCSQAEMIKQLQPVVDGISVLDGVEKIILFGSFAKNRQSITSDVDIAVVCSSDDTKSLRTSISLSINDLYKGDFDIQPTYISCENYFNDEHVLNVSGSIRKEGVILWQIKS
ncbi:MAG: nucleotidyltransferase domain-containing protein [Defluviitaleaceae bacterium]|nr:nucleotidyltransferase domain-containing protein [Defluviitaleaceae bacterium]MCL2261619.1 nucleotidyltransferase domain-containing protein [Defluviitaleaceae bacterium]